MADQLEQLRVLLAASYDVERLLGEGGMANVYLATDLKHERKVAIKVLKPELSATIGAERFLREIRVAASLQHPNILGMYDSGSADGLLYYVMPFIQGESLRDRLDRERQLPIEDALRIVRESAEALQYAHDRKIIHRDIKPENILLNDGHALVADFGIAKAIEDAGGEKLTKTGMAIGTPHYMSPEQSLGEALDGRSDQYSLGCVLYEVLVGQPPFDGPNAMAILARHSLEQVPSMQVVRNAIPDSVEDATFRALEKTPADRFATMRLFAEALTEAEAEASLARTQARRTPTIGRGTAQTNAAIRRTNARGVNATEELAVAPRRRWLPAVAGLAVVAAAFAGWRLLRPAPARPASAASVAGDARHVAVLYFKAENDSLRYLADGLTEGLIVELAAVPELDVVSRNGVAAFRQPDLAPDSVGRALRVGTLVTGEVAQDGGKVRGTIRLVDAVSGAEFQRASFEQPAGAYLTLKDSLAQKAASFLRERLGVELRLREQRSSTTSAEAWVLLQRAEQARKAAEAAVSAGDSAGTALRFHEADSLAALANERDASWNAATIFRGTIRYRQARLALNNPTVARARIDEGLGFAETALGRNNADADALELRGRLRYWRYLMRLEQGDAAKALLEQAKTDLLASTRLKPTQASAWSDLSHLYYQTGSLTDVMVAAQRAYESDAYLENAGSVINRLFLASYDLDQEVDAQHWCDEGQRRLPRDARFVMCRLYLMTMRGQNPDVAKAWAAATNEAVKNDVTTGVPEFRVREARMLVAAVLARAGQKDSARHVAQGALAGSDIDPTKSLYDLEAFVFTLAGDHPAAIAALKTFFAANPDRRKDFLPDPGWRFRPLATEPALREAVGAQ